MSINYIGFPSLFFLYPQVLQTSAGLVSFFYSPFPLAVLSVLIQDLEEVFV